MGRGRPKKRDRPWLCALEAGAARVFLSILAHLPLRFARCLGRWIGAVFFHLTRRYRDRSLANLDAAYGGALDALARKKMAAASLKNLGESIAELAHLRAGRGEAILASVRFDNPAVIERAYAAGKGLIYLTAHLGNWELMALAASRRFHPTGVVARRFDNPRLDRMVDTLRSLYGNRVIDKRDALRETLSVLKKGGAIGILLDQNVAMDEGVFVDFFGKPACTNKGPAVIAARTGAAVIPVFIHREGEGHVTSIGEPVRLADTGSAEDDVRANTAAFTKAIEEAVRLHPEEWLWGHDRWRTRPSEER